MCYVSLIIVKYSATSRGWRPAFPLIEMIGTYIQPVFDRRVQHGEVCEEDTQVGHSALGVGLCKRRRKKKRKCFIRPPEVSIHIVKSPHSEGFQSGRLQLFFKRWLRIQHITHTTALCSTSLLHAGRSPLQPSFKPLKHPPLSKSDISINV